MLTYWFNCVKKLYSDGCPIDISGGIRAMTGVVVSNEVVNKAHVLVVDDNAILLRTVKDMLAEDYSVAIAVSGAQAFMSIEKHKPDLILLDYEMPIVDGAEVFQLLRDDPKANDIPVIFLTASADREVVTKLISLNPAGYMLKPPKKDKLLEMIAGVLKKK